MFNALKDCLKEFESLNKQSRTPSQNFNNLQNKEYTQLEPFQRRVHNDAYTISTNVPDFKSFKYMTLTEAAKQHKLLDKSDKTAYKCFEAYANLNDANTKP